MRNGILLSIYLLCSTLLYAAPRTRQQAQAEAERFVNRVAVNGSKHAPKAQHLQWAHTVRMPQSATDLAYIFTSEQAEGFIIISADDCARTILGYAEAGTFDAERIPDNMQVWLQHYAEEIAYVSQTGAAARAPQQTTAIAPLLGATAWNQSEPFNQFCPMDGDTTRTFTGCVATAITQIMRYWQYPIQGTYQHSYTWYNCKRQPQILSADFGATTYDWDNMLDSYSDTSTYTQPQAEAVAILMYHFGVACEMSFGGMTVGGSGTNNVMAAQALFTYFGYDAGVRLLRSEYTGNRAFEDSIHAELLAGRPVMLSGYTERYEGHAFVCDGIDTLGLYHINWGWGGFQNGYFALSALDPDEQGIGGAASGKGFHVMVSAIVGIRPDAGGTLPDHVEIGARAFQLVSKEKIRRTSLVRVQLPEVINLGMEIFVGRVGVVVTDTTKTNTVQWLGFDDFTPEMNFLPNVGGNFQYYNYLTDLAPGMYELVPVYTDALQTEAYQMPIIEEQKSIRMLVTTDSIIFNPTEEDLDTDISNIPYEPTHCTKFIRNGILYIRYGEHIYPLRP